jgi:hypothetical protein
MAKKQTRRSISVSRTTYERLKAFCETNNISMSQLVETRVNDFLGPNDVAGSGAPIGAPVGPVGPRALSPMPPRAAMSSGSSSGYGNGSTSGPAPRSFDPRASHPAGSHPVASQAGQGASQGASQGHGAQAAAPASSAAHTGVPMTSAAARFAVEPPLPIIKPRQDTAAPKPAEKRPEQIFTF